MFILSFRMFCTDLKRLGHPLLSTPHGTRESNDSTSPFADCEKSLMAADTLPIDMRWSKCLATLLDLVTLLVEVVI